jgi:hypothetical protein
MAQSRKLKKVTKHKRNTRKYSSKKTRKSKMQSGSGKIINRIKAKLGFTNNEKEQAEQEEIKKKSREEQEEQEEIKQKRREEIKQKVLTLIYNYNNTSFYKKVKDEKKKDKVFIKKFDSDSETKFKDEILMEEFIAPFVENQENFIDLEDIDGNIYKISGEIDNLNNLYLFAETKNNKILINSFSIIPACLCRREDGFKYGWCGIAGGGVPACDH